MTELIHREFIVETPIKAAWRHLSQVKQWPSWAKHIKRIQFAPEGELTPTSKGILLLTNGIKSEFRMTELNAPRNWKWVGNFLWLTVHYDHRFEALDERRTKLIWIVGAEGFGASIIGKLFAAIYNKNLDRAIPNLTNEMKALQH